MASSTKFNANFFEQAQEIARKCLEKAAQTQKPN